MLHHWCRLISSKMIEIFDFSIEKCLNEQFQKIYVVWGLTWVFVLVDYYYIFLFENFAIIDVFLYTVDQRWPIKRTSVSHISRWFVFPSLTFFWESLHVYRNSLCFHLTYSNLEILKVFLNIIQACWWILSSLIYIAWLTLGLVKFLNNFYYFS